MVESATAGGKRVRVLTAVWQLRPVRRVTRGVAWWQRVVASNWYAIPCPADLERVAHKLEFLDHARCSLQRQHDAGGRHAPVGLEANSAVCQARFKQCTLSPSWCLPKSPAHRILSCGTVGVLCASITAYCMPTTHLSHAQLLHRQHACPRGRQRAPHRGQAVHVLGAGEEEDDVVDGESHSGHIHACRCRSSPITPSTRMRLRPALSTAASLTCT